MSTFGLLSSLVSGHGGVPHEEGFLGETHSQLAWSLYRVTLMGAGVCVAFCGKIFPRCFSVIYRYLGELERFELLGSYWVLVFHVLNCVSDKTDNRRCNSRYYSHI